MVNDHGQVVGPQKIGTHTSLLGEEGACPRRTALIARFFIPHPSGKSSSQSRLGAVSKVASSSSKLARNASMVSRSSWT